MDPNYRYDESARLAALENYAILDTAPEIGFDDLTQMAAAICGVPISLVSFVAESRQWFKSARGVGKTKETSRDVSFCAHTLQNRQTLVVPDALLSPVFQDNALVTGEPRIRFYAGAPIVERGGHALGTICVIDTKPRTLTTQQIEALEALSRQASSLLELRRVASEQAGLAEGARQALRQARMSQEQLALAVDAAELAAWYYDPVEGVVGGDARMAALFGLANPKGPAEIWLNAIVDEDRERVGEEFAAGLRGEPYDTTYRVRVEADVRWLHARARMIQSVDGSAQIVGICEDVTREKMLAVRLEQTAERLFLAQGVSGAATFDWNLGEDTITWGRGCFGRSPSSLRSSKDVFALLPEEDQIELGRVLTNAIQNGIEYRHEFRAYAPDGSLLWYQTSGKPLIDESGKTVSVVGVNLDVTDRKLSEEALLRAEKLAAVGRLASTISHEINNPLEAVTNLLFILRSSERLSDQDREHLEIADRELARVSHITAQTLRFHRNPLNATKIRVRALIDETLELYRTRLASSAIEVDVEVDPRLSFTGYEGDIRQVLNNLVGNAFDAMRQGGTLFVRASSVQNWRKREKGIAITVADTGRGIDAVLHRRIFDAFFSTKGIGGTGLGLWISHRIVHKHKGELNFRSRTGDVHGTVFRLWLPCEVADTASDGWAE